MTRGEAMPLLSALSGYAARDTARFHMPGHKGRMPEPFDAVARIDFTELDGTGNLYTEEDGAIRRSEALMAELYGAYGCMYLTGGATQGVFSMLAACAAPGDTVLIDRCCHKSVLHAAALLDLRPIYLQRDIINPFGISDGLSPDRIPDAKCMIVTSPTYYGVISDIGMLKKMCGQKGIKLLVDSAHGAHLRFISDETFIPDIAVYSAHKTLNALGQSSFLLYGPDIDSERLRFFTSVFGTSSPSYPLMASLDMCRAGLMESGTASWSKLTFIAGALRDKYRRLLTSTHIRAGWLDTARLCLFSPPGYDTALRFESEYGVTCEMADANNIVFILTANDTDSSIKRLDKALGSLESVHISVSCKPPEPLPKVLLSPREALLSQHEDIPLSAAAGRAAGRAVAPYPPGVPLVCPGEIFDKKHVEILSELWYNDNEKISVIKG